ncbi:biotin--protein ligase [Toxorhynchites rutilus septentrionalis]|uniref:biotin--protein ligase n=1 Tax=Toxorhynchites rutilus septentrionalis TaxID=329112 RepID=UPI002479BDCE|nr:biotin--protein ligase [Toxorhynchites rutilus septentrionalis]
MIYLRTRIAIKLFTGNNGRQLFCFSYINPFRHNTTLKRLPPRIQSNNQMSVKPPNILVYSNLVSVKQNLVTTLRTIVSADKYTVYPVTEAQLKAAAWPESTALLLVHGTIDSGLAGLLLIFFLRGGKLLSVCSNLLNIALNRPTDESKAPERVTLNYGVWQNQTVLQLVEDFDTKSAKSRLNEFLKNLDKDAGEADLDVLISELTFDTPSTICATDSSSNGKALFTSLDASNFIETDSGRNVGKFATSLLSDLLHSILRIEVQTSETKENLIYKDSYLLGEADVKSKFLNAISEQMEKPSFLNLNELALHFCDTKVIPPSATILPVLINHIPEDFSTLDYYRNLKTTLIGRIGIYVPVVRSSTVIVSNASLSHGFVVIPRRQTHGNGRNNNQWLSPEGCVMFSMQLHVPLASQLGRRLPIIQHLVAIAIILAVRTIPDYEELDIRLKWPNDIYANGVAKIGGIIINSRIQSSVAVVNVGCGVNLSNSNPTTCINDLIREFNRNHGKHLPVLGYEQMLGLIFTKIEELYNEVQEGDLSILQNLYYKYWLHDNKMVAVKNEAGISYSGKIVGIDEYGYLLVRTGDGDEPVYVQPDGNSFDMMKGLIIPKYC